MIVAYSLTCPIGIAIGIAVSGSYDPASTQAAATQVSVNHVLPGLSAATRKEAGPSPLDAAALHIPALAPRPASTAEVSVLSQDRHATANSPDPFCRRIVQRSRHAARLANPSALTQGVFNAVSAGMLLYISLVQLVAEDFSRRELVMPAAADGEQKGAART